MASQQFTLEEAAERLGCSVATVRRRIKAGSLQAERIRHAGGFTYLVHLDAAPEPVAVGSSALEALRREHDDALRRLDIVLSLLQAEQQRSHELTLQVIHRRPMQHPRWRSLRRSPKPPSSMWEGTPGAVRNGP